MLHISMLLHVFFTDTDECSNSTLNHCDASATCTNTEGSYTCVCNAGYIGNGTSCAGDVGLAVHYNYIFFQKIEI